MKFRLLLITLVLWATTASAVETVNTWDATEESLPADSESLALANERMQDIKVNVRARAEVEHWWGDTGAGDDNGMHRHGSARCFASNSAPTTLSDSQGTLESSAPVLYAVTDLNDSASNSAGGVEDDVGHGRCWIDLDGADNVAGNDDDYAMYIYEGEAGDNTPATIADGWNLVSVGYSTSTLATGHTHTEFTDGTTDDEILAGSSNLIYNGSFEATDGTGSAASTTVPAGWALILTPTIAYVDPSGDDSYGEGYHIAVTGAGAASEGISFELDALPEDAVYKVLARAKDDGTTICTLDVSGNGGAAFTPVSTTTHVWETLSGTFGTDTSAKDDNVLVELTTVTDTRVCAWDNIRIYQINDVTTDRPELSTPSGVTLFRDSVTLSSGVVDTTPTAVTGLTISVNPPSQNCVVEVDAVLAFQVEEVTASDQDIGVLCQLDENGTNRTTMRFGGSSPNFEGSAGTSKFAFHIPIHYDVANPAPGTPLVYIVECADKLEGASDNTDYDCDEASCYLNAKMFCGGY